MLKNICLVTAYFVLEQVQNETFFFQKLSRSLYSCCFLKRCETLGSLTTFSYRKTQNPDKKRLDPKFLPWGAGHSYCGACLATGHSY